MLSSFRHPSPAIRFRVLAPGLTAFCAIVLLGACDRAPSDLREWRPADHDHQSNPNAGQVEVQKDGGSPLAAFGIDEVTLVAWKENCSKCHGPLGAGDGPQGPMNHARDLSNPAWQASVGDAAIARSIREGRGRMPAFQLPDATVNSLVKLVRLFDASRQRQPAADGDDEP